MARLALLLWSIRSPVGLARAAEPAAGSESFPPWKQFEVQPKDQVEFRLPGRGGQRRWTVNGKAAGEGEQFILSPASPGKVTVRGTGTDDAGRAVERVWEVDVRGNAGKTTAVTPVPTPRAAVAPPPPAPAPRPARVSRPASRGARTSPDIPPSRTDGDTAAVPPAAVEPPVAPSAPPPVAASGPDDVRGLLARYADAYRQRDVEALRRIGQVTSDSQAQQMRDYFDKTPQLDVEVKILDVSKRGDKTTVRFTRRDRFKDPSGQDVSQETPPIEKEVVDTPEGLRLKAVAD
jgi:hypothetical protein